MYICVCLYMEYTKDTHIWRRRALKWNNTHTHTHLKNTCTHIYLQSLTQTHTRGRGTWMRIKNKHIHTNCIFCLNLNELHAKHARMWWNHTKKRRHSDNNAEQLTKRTGKNVVFIRFENILSYSTIFLVLFYRIRLIFFSFLIPFHCIALHFILFYFFCNIAAIIHIDVNSKQMYDGNK